MTKFLLTGCLLVLLASFLNYPTNSENTNEPRKAENEVIFPISEQIKIARLEKNISQSDLASRLGISKANLSRIENGQQMPNQKIVGKIQAELGTRLTFNGY